MWLKKKNKNYNSILCIKNLTSLTKNYWKNITAGYCDKQSLQAATASISMEFPASG